VSAWTREELDRIGAAEELEIAPRRGDGSLRRPVPIWVVRVGEELYVRSWRGSDGAWYRAARTRGTGRVSSGGVERDVAFVDAREELYDAYRDKYARYPSYVPPMIGGQARATTLELIPRDGEGAA
jgi:hypothetical protein